MPHVGMMKLDTYGLFYHMYATGLQSLRAFPDLRWRGCKVTPEYWKPDSVEPVVRVLLMNGDLDTERVFGVDFLPQDERTRRLADMGWTVNYRDGHAAWVHVDELEKTEGPIPEGTF
jgi:hypothetical protein